MRSFTIVVVIIAFVAIVAKHSSVATHDSDSQELRRRLNGDNDDEREQYNMFLRHVVQQLTDDEDDDESFRATMRNHVHSATSASKAASKAATNTASKAATNTAHLSTSSKCTEIVIGKDNYGGDMDAAHPAQVHSPAACAALCEQYPDCTAWTFNIQSAKCWTKDKTTSLNASPDAITGTCKKSSK
ncbi:unnamed protein product [Adineta steineri]|uniref:Apple domain-containing protein n=2 Tax=Adineta steineri TaxID=433720 RepID=A0A818ZLP4_9BILA|nr:unnamed protein product [Adineta steineri]CAF3765306.1 unnamed protein product [Adineta steineri]CAF4157220.1 unnamed protein product [Adineta steineri]